MCYNDTISQHAANSRHMVAFALVSFRAWVLWGDFGLGSLFRCPWWTRTSILTRLIPKDASSQSKGLNTQNGKLCAGILQNSIGTHNAYGRTSLRFYAILNLVTLKFRFWVRSPVLNFSTGTARRRKVSQRRNFKVAQENLCCCCKAPAQKSARWLGQCWGAQHHQQPTILCILC